MLRIAFYIHVHVTPAISAVILIYVIDNMKPSVWFLLNNAFIYCDIGKPSLIKELGATI